MSHNLVAAPSRGPLWVFAALAAFPSVVIVSLAIAHNWGR